MPDEVVLCPWMIGGLVKFVRRVLPDLVEVTFDRVGPYSELLLALAADHGVRPEKEARCFKAKFVYDFLGFQRFDKAIWFVDFEVRENVILEMVEDDKSTPIGEMTKSDTNDLVKISGIQRELHVQIPQIEEISIVHRTHGKEFQVQAWHFVGESLSPRR